MMHVRTMLSCVVAANDRNGWRGSTNDETVRNAPVLRHFGLGNGKNLEVQPAGQSNTFIVILLIRYYS